eukprot:TRINITY_DN690_c0_g1_i4.p1 TRINITY_DN690_c0_g1~~TRINITY_DN690_c0_g1_i4.p1  ORF type:complete len:315 (+),score=46.37 TRINITY_DN690_c0_g1_i4:53-946(+)
MAATAGAVHDRSTVTGSLAASKAEVLGFRSLAGVSNVLLLGPSGAGKSSLIKTLCGALGVAFGGVICGLGRRGTVDLRFHELVNKNLRLVDLWGWETAGTEKLGKHFNEVFLFQLLNGLIPSGQTMDKPLGRVIPATPVRIDAILFVLQVGEKHNDTTISVLKNFFEATEKFMTGAGGHIPVFIVLTHFDTVLQHWEDLTQPLATNKEVRASVDQIMALLKDKGVPSCEGCFPIINVFGRSFLLKNAEQVVYESVLRVMEEVVRHLGTAPMRPSYPFSLDRLYENEDRCQLDVVVPI